MAGRNGDGLYLSVVTIAEVIQGVAWLEHRGASRKAALLQSWLDDLTTFHGHRILPIDRPIAEQAGRLVAKARAGGVMVDSEDAYIAATGVVAGLTILTANSRHFMPMGVRFLDPFSQLPPDLA